MLKFNVTFKNGLLIRDLGAFLSLVESHGGEAVAVVKPPLGGDVLKNETPQCPSCLEDRKVGLFWTCERCGERWSADTSD